MNHETLDKRQEDDSQSYTNSSKFSLGKSKKGDKIHQQKRIIFKNQKILQPQRRIVYLREDIEKRDAGTSMDIQTDNI